MNPGALFLITLGTLAIYKSQTLGKDLLKEKCARRFVSCDLVTLAIELFYYG